MARLTKTTPAIYRRHVKGCERSGGCECPYVVVWRRCGREHRETFRTAAEARPSRDTLRNNARERLGLWFEPVVGLLLVVAVVAVMVALALLTYDDVPSDEPPEPYGGCPPVYRC